MSILFNGQVLVAHHHPGASPYLLVTFMGAYHEGEAERSFLMRELVERDGIACVGVTHRVRNLYVSDEIDAIAAEVRKIRRPNQKLVMIGQSGGGYAAIKYAARFGADHVLSFSPMYSLHEDDLEIGDNAHHRFLLRASMRFHRIPREIVRSGMRPTSEDCPVPSVIVFDACNYNDNYAARLYARDLPGTRLIQARHMGHALLNRIGDSGFMTEMLDRIVRNDTDGTCAMLHRLVRNDPDAIGDLLVRLARWKPSLVPMALRTHRVVENLKPGFRRRHPFNNVLAHGLVARGRTEEAYAHLTTIHPDLLPSTGTSVAAPGSQDVPPGLYLVLSFHGDILGYHGGRGEVRFSSTTLHPGGELPLLLDTRGAAPRFVINMRDGEKEIVVDGTDGDAARFAVVPATEFLVAFRRGSAFLRGDLSSIPRFAAAEACEWEQFALLPVPNTGAFRLSTAMNWFEQAAMAASAPSGMAPPPQKKAFRSVLQRLFN